MLNFRLLDDQRGHSGQVSEGVPLPGQTVSTIGKPRRVFWTLLEGHRNASFEEQYAGRLFNEIDFWHAFKSDLRRARANVTIVCPFVHEAKGGEILALLSELVERGVKVFVHTRPGSNYYHSIRGAEAERLLEDYEENGVNVVRMYNVHQKVALIDRSICWEGSLNILSHRHSMEHMRRLEGTSIVEQMRANLRLL